MKRKESTSALIISAQNAAQLAANLKHSAMNALVADINELREGDQHPVPPTSLFWEAINHHASEGTFSFVLPCFNNEPETVKALVLEWFRLYNA